MPPVVGHTGAEILPRGAGPSIGHGRDAFERIVGVLFAGVPTVDRVVFREEAMGRGVIDWAGQFRALKQDGYRHAVTLETHWRGAGTPEESSRQSFAGMKELLLRAGAYAP